MNTPGIGKWKIGLLVLGLLSIGLFVYVIIQGISSKQDRQTEKKAEAIATKLNSYNDNHDTVPDSLAAVGITDVPNTISYHKEASDTYQFCITYKQSNIDVTADAQSKLYNAATGGSFSTGGSVNFGGSSYAPPTLYINPSHKSGKQCQKVQTYGSYIKNFEKFNSANPTFNSSLYSQ